MVSEQLRREIEVGGIRLHGQVETIPNWITGTRGANQRDFYRGGHLRIMTAGQVARWKGIDVLIEAAARLRDAGHDDFSVHIYGKVHQPDLASLIHSLHLSDHVILQGVLPHALLLEAYRDYDLFAFPTFEREPFGLVPLEAVARGCVPIISRRCGIAEWLVHGVHCLKAERGRRNRSPASSPKSSSDESTWSPWPAEARRPPGATFISTPSCRGSSGSWFAPRAKPRGSPGRLTTPIDWPEWPSSSPPRSLRKRSPRERIPHRPRLADR